MNNAFLHGLLDKSVYMEQPPGYMEPKFPSHVCLLKKAIYGLKQAPQAWFYRFSSFLLIIGFSCSTADTSFFVFHKGTSILYLLLYVDAIIVTGNTTTLIDSIVSQIRREFVVKDSGCLNYFLGLESITLNVVYF